MPKLKWGLFVFIILALFVRKDALALSIPGGNIYPRPPVISNSNFLGENQNYTVLLRGNGEAAVSFKSVIFNSNDSPLSNVQIHFDPQVQLREIEVFQVLQQPTCISYRQTYAQQNQAFSQSGTNAEIQSPQLCEQYSEPDFQNISGDATYRKAVYYLSNYTLFINLPQPIETNKSGSYIVFYRSNSYTRKNIFGTYEYFFQIPKFDNNINSLQIGLSTDSDYYLRENKGTINYYSGSSTFSPPLMLRATSNLISGSQFDDYYNQIGSGDITKNASGLAPLETYTLQGLFADSQIKLYAKDIVATICVLILIVILLFLIIKYIIFKFIARRKEKDISQSKNANSRIKLFLVSGAVSLVSIFLMCLYTFSVFLIFFILRFTQFNTAVILIIFFVSFAVYPFLLFVPSIFLAVKKGWVWGTITLGLTFFWVLAFLILIIMTQLIYSPFSNITSLFQNFFQ